MRKKHYNQEPEDAVTNSSVSLVRDKVSIAVSCSDSSVMNKIIAAKRKTGLLNFAMLDKSQLPGNTATFLSENNFNIYVNELLPYNTYILLGKSRKILKPAGVKFIWSRNGHIHAKINEQSLTYTINTLDDIERL